MTIYRKIITVDGNQVAIVNKFGVVLEHEVNQWKRQFAKQNNIGYGGIGCIYAIPKEGLIEWQPIEQKDT